MMSCECNSTLIEFPQSLVCILAPNYEVRTETEYPIGEKPYSRTFVKGDFSFSSFEDIQLFSVFYTQDIDYGREPFLIDLPIYGKLLEKERIIDEDGSTEVKKGWLVKFKSPLNWGDIRGNTGTMSYELEVLDSLDEIQVCDLCNI
jgi:hypothetical protein